MYVLDECVCFWICVCVVLNKCVKECGKNFLDCFESGKVFVEGEVGGVGDLGEGCVGVFEDVGDVFGFFGWGFGVKFS